MKWVLSLTWGKVGEAWHKSCERPEPIHGVGEGPEPIHRAVAPLGGARAVFS